MIKISITHQWHSNLYQFNHTKSVYSMVITIPLRSEDFAFYMFLYMLLLLRGDINKEAKASLFIQSN